MTSNEGSIRFGEPRNIKLDLINKKILQLLIQNSRIRMSEMGKIVNLSKSNVINRVRKMEKNRLILDYVILSDLKKLGYSYYILFLKVPKRDLEKFDLYAAKLSFVTAAITLEGEWNILLLVHSKGLNHFDNLLEKLNAYVKVADFQIVEIGEFLFRPYNLLDVDVPDFFAIRGNSSKKEEKAKIDLYDNEILKFLTLNARVSLVDLGKKLDLNYETINYRIKNLHRSGAILGFFTNIDVFSLGFQPFLIFIKSFNRKKENILIDFLLKHRRSSGIYRLISSEEIMAVFLVKDVLELRKIMKEIKSNFPQIMNLRAIMVLDLLYQNFYPEGVYNDIKSELKRKKRF